MSMKLTTGALLAHDKLDRYRPFGAFGKPCYQSHVQLKAMLMAKLGPKCANYFARPVLDSDAGDLRWTAEVPGVARGWHDMSPEEQGQAALDLELIRSKLLSYVTELRQQGQGQPGGASAYASLLEQALKVPEQKNFLHFVGDQPIISFWGFETQAGASVDASVLVPKYAASVSNVAEASSVTSPNEPQQKKRLWWWLLWLLLALLLLLLLLAGMRACTPEGKLDFGRILSGLTEPEKRDHNAQQPDALTGLGTPSAMISPGGLVLPGGVTADGLPPSGLDARTLAPEGAASAPLPGQEGGPNDKGMPKDLLKDAAQAREEDKSQDKDKTKDGKPLTDLAAVKEDPNALKVPKDVAAADKLNFLEGKWKAGEGLQDNQTKQPLDMSFKFSKDGKGEITMRRQDGSTCTGAVQGKMNGGKLGIEGNQSIPCTNGTSYAPPKIECIKDSSGQTQCFGINSNGSRYYMGVQRQP